MNLIEIAQRNQTKKLIAEWLEAKGLTLVREPSPYEDGSAAVLRGTLRLTVSFYANHTGVHVTFWGVQFLFDATDPHPCSLLQGPGQPPDDVWERALVALDKQVLETRQYMQSIEAAYVAALKEINP